MAKGLSSRFRFRAICRHLISSSLAAMFCCSCGTKSLVENAKYCSNCGVFLSNPTNESSHKTIGFEEFKKRKDTERSSRFQPKKKLKASSTVSKTKAKETEVVINIGFLKLEASGNLKRCRGKTLPVKVKPTANAQCILDKGVTKHSNHDKKIHEGLEYVLLYPDHSEVVNLPGTTEQFILEKYREDVGKAYNRITLFIAQINDFLMADLPTLDDDIEIDLDDDDTDLETSVSLKKTAVHEVGGPSDEIMTRAAPSGISNSLLSVNTGTSEDKAIVIDNPSPNYPNTDTVKILNQVECPTCFLLFPISAIADHADTCIDVWVGDIGVDADSQIDTALSIGKDDFMPVVNETLSLKEVIPALLRNMSINKPVRLNIRRKHIWKDFKVAYQQGVVRPEDHVKIVFIGEPAIDDGGPRREFFSEILDYVERNLFHMGKPTDSMVALNDKDYFLAGIVMVMSILQGGPSPAFLHPSVFAYLSNGSLSPDDNVNEYKTIALKIHSVKDDKELHEVLLQDDVLEVLEQIGYKGVPQKETQLSSKSIIESICIKSQLAHIMPQLMQLQEGLSSCGVITSVQEKPHLWENVFSFSKCSEDLTAEEFMDQLVANFSISQVQKEKEIDVYKFFCDFLQATDQGRGGGITVQEIMKWISGTKTAPLLGFQEQLSIAFVHGCPNNCRCRPTASTCDLSMKLPVHINSLSEMMEMMTSAIKDCVGFGRV